MFCVHCHGSACRGEIFLGIPAGCGGSGTEGDVKETLPAAESCTECGSRVGEHSLAKYAETCDIVAEKLNAAQVPAETTAFCFRLMSQSRFTAHHILFLKVTEVAFDNYLAEIEKLNEKEESTTTVDDEVLEAALCHGLNLLSGYARYSQHCWSHEGFYLLRVAEIEFVLGNNEDCEAHLRKAETILRTSMGQTGAKKHLTRILQLLTMLDSP
jgi:hypothetical protein